MAGFGSFPTHIGLSIGSLKPGDQVRIKAGQGWPKVEVDTVDVIWQIGGVGSALTAGGIVLSCYTVTAPDGFVATGEHLDKFDVTEEAKAIAAEADRRQAMAAIEDDLEL